MSSRHRHLSPTLPTYGSSTVRTQRDTERRERVCVVRERRRETEWARAVTVAEAVEEHEGLDEHRMAVLQPPPSTASTPPPLTQPLQTHTLPLEEATQAPQRCAHACAMSPPCAAFTVSTYTTNMLKIQHEPWLCTSPST